MWVEIFCQGQSGLFDESFCDLDVVFYCVLVDSVGNYVLLYQLVGVVEVIQFLMNMIIFLVCLWEKIIELYMVIVDGVENYDVELVDEKLVEFSVYMLQFSENVVKECFKCK